MKNHGKKLLAMFLALAMVLSLLPGSVLTANAVERPEEPTDLALLEQQMKEALSSADERTYAEDYVAPETVDPNEVVRVIVELEHQPALSRMKSGNVTLASAQQSALNSQEAIIQRVSRELNAEPVHRMSLSSNAVSYEVRRCDIEKLAQMPGIRSVTEAHRYQPQVFSAKEMTGVYEAWKMGESGYTGKGMTIAVIDTGVNYLHQDMTQNPETVKFTKAEMETKIQSLGRGEWFSDKVPFGYSYVAGHEYIVSQVEPHGHHVAGIAAANSQRDEIDGVAPDAQVYAMQVFDPLTGGGGYEDDIICAIEDAVALGADVINMSLGTDAGFYGSDRYISRAVDAAEAEGVFVAVAAGNSGNSAEKNLSYTNITNDWGISDTAMISDPATAAGATSVAAIDGHGFITYRFGMTVNGEERKIYCSPISNHNFDFPDGVGFVDCGSIDTAELTAGAVKGKIVLLLVNPETTEMYQYYMTSRNVESLGGAGIIFYSENQHLSKKMSGMRKDYYSIPMAYVALEDAQYMQSLAENGTTAVMAPYDQAFFFASEPGVNRASSFTSWGPTPTLEIKPEIAAPGGAIFSVGDGADSYYIMSGTSMASPFIAGSAAVVKQAIAEANLDIENKADFIRKSMMNTADTVLETNFDQIASVRQVGAGMVNVADAVENRVLATYHGKAAIELLDNLAATTTGTIQLKNFGDQAVTYTLSATDVFTDTIDEGTNLYHNIVLEGAQVTFSAASVTVPANGTASVDFTLTIGAPVEGHFAEGYIQLGSDAAPDLSLPFLGFMGDWDDGTIIDAPTWEENTITTRPSMGYYGDEMHGTCLMNISGDVLGEIYTEDTWGHSVIDPERIAFSPNGDGISDVVIPWLTMLRNGQEVRMEVLDQSGKVIATPGSAFNLRKITAADDLGSNVDGTLMRNTNHAVSWDGTTLDSATNTWNVVPEGNYTVRVSARVREGGAWQSVELPLKVDLTPPVISDLHVSINGQYATFTFKASDNLALNDLMTFALKDQIEILTFARNGQYDEETGLYTFVYDNTTPIEMGKGAFHTSLMVQDGAGNTATDYYVINGDQETAEAGFENLPLGRTTPIVATGAITLYRVLGFAPAGSTVTINEIQTTVEEDGFELLLPLTLGNNTLHVLIQDADGQILLSGTANLYAATEADIPNFSAPVLGGGYKATAVSTNNVLVLDENYPDGTVIPVTVKLSNTEHATVTNNGLVVKPDENGYVTFEVTLQKGCATYSLEAVVDANGALSNAQDGQIYTPDAAESKADGISLTPVYTPRVWNLGTFAGVTPENLNEDGTYTVYGCLVNPVDKLTVCGKEVTVNAADLTWSCDITLKEGFNLIPVVAEKDGVEYPAVGGKILYQTGGPVLDVNVKDREVIFLDSSEFKLDGTVTTHLDDAQVYLNDTMIMGAQNYGHAYGQETITRDLEQTLQLQPGSNYYTLTAYNYLGLGTTIQFNLYYGHCDHEKTELQDAKEATCTEDGYTGDQVCTECSYVVKSGEAIPALGHKTELQGAKEATCTEDGYTGDWFCTVCEQIVERGQVIPASHTPELRGVKEPTCTEEGYTGDTVCAVCGEILEEGQSIPATGHDYITKVVKPDCCFRGYTLHTCVNCGHNYISDPVDPLEHTPVVKNAVEATCTEDGYTGNIVCQICGTILEMGTVIPANCPASAFTDLDVNQCYHPYVDYVIKAGLMNGVSQTSFAPNANVTRGQVVTILYRLSGETVSPTAYNPFADVAENTWYYDAVVWAYGAGIAQGMNKGVFAPNAPVTREQMVTFLARYAQYTEKTVTGGDLSGYTDAGQVSDYAEQAMAWAVENGIIQGMTETTLVPRGTATRAQLAAIILRFALLKEN